MKKIAEKKNTEIIITEIFVSMVIFTITSFGVGMNFDESVFFALCFFLLHNKSISGRHILVVGCIFFFLIPAAVFFASRKLPLFSDLVYEKLALYAFFFAVLGSIKRLLRHSFTSRK